MTDEEEEPTYIVKTISGQDYTGEGLIREVLEAAGVNASHNEQDVWIPNANIESVHGELGEIEEVYDLDSSYDDSHEVGEPEEDQPSTFREAVESDTIEQEFTIDELSALSVDDEELLEEAIEVDSRKGAVSVYEDRLDELNE